MRVRGFIAFVVAVLFLAIVPLTPGAQSVKVFDRTLVCTTGDGGPQIAAIPDTGRFTASIGIERTFTGGHSQLVVVTAGARSVLAVDEQFCKRSTNRVPLTRKGLPGPPTAYAIVKCPLGRILVRVRYAYMPGPHRRDADLGGRLVSAALAVRSYRTLRPLAFVSLTDSGRKLRLYSSAACRIG